jgi:hypothetical protein
VIAPSRTSYSGFSVVSSDQPSAPSTVPPCTTLLLAPGSCAAPPRHLHHTATTFPALGVPAPLVAPLRDSRLKRMLPHRPHCHPTSLDPPLKFRCHRTSLAACHRGHRVDLTGGDLALPSPRSAMATGRTPSEGREQQARGSPTIEQRSIRQQKQAASEASPNTFLYLSIGHSCRIV